jgi:hypothetical protein
MLKNTSTTTRIVVRLAIPLAGVALLVASLVVRQSSARSLRLASTLAEESRTAAALRVRASLAASPETA